MQFARNQHCRKPASQTKIFTSEVFHLKKNLKISHRNLYLQNGTNGIKIFFNVPMINDSDIKKQRETDVSFVKFHWDFASENMTLCVTRGVVVIALMSPAPAVHVDASDPGFMDFTYPAVLRKSKSIPWIRLSRVFVESLWLWVLFICLCFVHVCPFGHTDIGHVTCRIYGAYYGALWKSKFSYWSLSWLQMFDACRGILEICWKLNRSICHICPLPTWLFWSGQAQKKRKMFDSGHRFRGQGTGLPGSATCIDTDRTFFQALGSGLGVVEKNGVGGGTKEGEGWERANRGSLTDSLHVVVC